MAGLFWQSQGESTMPKRAKELGPLDVKRLEHPGGKHPIAVAVGGVAGLHMQIKPTGAKSWLLRTVVGEKRRNIGLGAYPDVTLAQARERAREARETIWRGVDPVEERKAARAALTASQRRGLMFADALDRFAKEKTKEFSSERYRKQWRVTIDTYATPVLGKMLVSDIRTEDVLRVLQPIWTDKTVTAKKLRQRIERILDFAAVAGHRSGPNPATWKGNIEHILPAPGKIAKAENWPALSLDQAPEWFADLRSRDGIATRALEFLTLTAARSGDVRGATWAEIDLGARLWTISAARMKGDREHRVPLTDEAVKLLEPLPRLEGSPYVFPAARGGMLSDAALSACMKRIHEARAGGFVDRRSGRPAVPHGLRSTFRDWAAERTNFPRDMAEIALAHVVGSEVERAYRRTDMMEKRRGMMAAWGRFLRAEGGNKVINMRRGGA